MATNTPNRPSSTILPNLSEAVALPDSPALTVFSRPAAMNPTRLTGFLEAFALRGCLDLN